LTTFKSLNYTEKMAIKKTIRLFGLILLVLMVKPVLAQDYDNGPLSYPTAAFNSQTGEYLVVGFTGDANAYPVSPGKIVGQRYLRITPVSSRIFLVNDIDSKNMPFVIYNSRRNEFLVVFMRVVNDWDIRAIRVNAQGQRISSSEIIVSDAPDQQWVPQVAYNPDRDEYLVTWHDMRYRATPSQKDIFGQFISGDGQLIGQNFLISMDNSGNPAPNVQQYSSLAYNPRTKNFLIVWGDRRNEYQSDTIYDVYGAFVSGETHQVVGAQKNFLINHFAAASRPYQERNEYPQVAYNFARDEFLVVWQQRTTNPDAYIINGVEYPGRSVKVFAMRVEGNGNLSREPIILDNEAGIFGRIYDLPRPVVSCNWETGVCLTGWRNFMGAYVQGRFFLANGAIGDSFQLGNASNNPRIFLASAPPRREFLEVLGHNSFGIFAFSEPGVSSCPNEGLGNFDCDPQGLINERDLTIFLSRWGQQGIGERELEILLANWGS